MKNLKLQKGFTLIEMLVAMSIFIVFTGILLTSYTNIIRTQREADDYRIMYSEARKVFDNVVAELREGIVDYGCANNPVAVEASEISLINKNGVDKSKVFLDPETEDKTGIVKIGRGEVYGDVVDLNSSEVNVKELKFFPYPLQNPYGAENVDIDAVQFQPKVTVFALFEKKRRNGEVFSLKLQTTVSSRIYQKINSCVL